MFFENVLLKFAVCLENISVNIRQKIKDKKKYIFLKKYDLIDEFREEVVEGKYNSYDATNLIIIDRLIENGIISKDDNIIDIGCGTGIFLLYLASKGFINLNGVEIDKKLYMTLKNNINNFIIHSKKNIHLNIKNEDALKLNIDTYIDCIFLANPLVGYNEYNILFNNIKNSIELKNRKIKIIIFRMTNELKKVLMNCKWIEFDNLYVFKEQICYHCFNIVVVKSLFN